MTTNSYWDLRKVWGSTTGKLSISTLLLLIDLVSQQKSAHHQSGTVSVTTHRLFYYSAQSPDKYSFSFDLAHTTQTDYYAGLFTSSSKVTLHLGSLDDVADTEDDIADGWECHLCSYRNPPGTSRNAQVCALCGVPRSDPPEHSPSSKSLPPSRSVTPFSSEIACMACTFLNSASSKVCEICGNPLPGTRSGTAPPSPALKPISGSDPRLIKVSFRKGGDKNFYTILKRSLQGKAWEVS
jgi:ESCRT-II complex subunit VPS36